ncbi:MAG: UDP-N-acetylmuramate dehydrogenase [Candidatus Pacebacteria bacterium]|nr:UDP-N-acetylmuramate dehydrogenase [Candidatus Paceibacterota bacterium]MCF7862468.1 UDP-N-acetylmuramate dehydrogenase [Candidatus Paceibacterota bacterium]
MTIQFLENYDLTHLNTFGVKAKAKFFVELQEEGDIKELFSSDIFKENKKIFLGGGSNTLFVNDFDGLLVLNRLKGISILEENEESILLRVMSGENWHDFVMYSVNKGLWGIESLALIPGTVGGAPVQNIGAYGAEAKNTIVEVESYEMLNGEKKILQNNECQFGYRDSAFKNSLKGKVFISAVLFKLNKKSSSVPKYEALDKYLKEKNLVIKTSKDISEAVIEVRQSKLPDPKIVGNSGSFFKNVFVQKEKIEDLQVGYPDLPFFEDEGIYKIPAGWLIEKAGWKGKSEGNVGVHDKQALVLINKGGATGMEVKNFSEKIIQSILEKFNLKLEREVNIIE